MKLQFKCQDDFGGSWKKNRQRGEKVNAKRSIKRLTTISPTKDERVLLLFYCSFNCPASKSFSKYVYIKYDKVLAI